MHPTEFSKDGHFLLRKIGIVLTNDKTIEIFSQGKRPKILLTTPVADLTQIFITISMGKTKYNFWNFLTVWNQGIFSTDPVNKSTCHNLIFSFRNEKKFTTQIADFDLIRTERIIQRINESFNPNKQQSDSQLIK